MEILTEETSEYFANEIFTLKYNNDFYKDNEFLKKISEKIWKRITKKDKRNIGK